MEKRIVYIPKVGDHIDDNAFGGHYVTEESQARIIKSIKERWNRDIKCPKQFNSRCVEGNGDIPYPHMEYFITDNPYFGWEERQLEIIER